MTLPRIAGQQLHKAMHGACWFVAADGNWLDRWKCKFYCFSVAQRNIVEILSSSDSTNVLVFRELTGIKIHTGSPLAGGLKHRCGIDLTIQTLYYMAFLYPTFINFQLVQNAWLELSLALIVQSPHRSPFPISTGSLSISE